MIPVGSRSLSVKASPEILSQCPSSVSKTSWHSRFNMLHWVCCQRLYWNGCVEVRLQSFPDILEANGIAWPNPSMWRAPSLFHSSVPLPVYQPDDALQSHAHSPRRSGLRKPSSFQALQGSQGFPGSSMPMGTSLSLPNAFLSNMGFPPGPPVPPRNASGGVSTESFDNLAYFDWINSLSGPFANDFTGKAMWPPPGLNRATASSSDNNDLMQPEYMSQGTNHPTYGEPMHLSGPSLEDDPIPTTDLTTKVPTNTPTAACNFDHTNTSCEHSMLTG
jgi:hypothetical protein